ncbi:transposon Tf2-6 polyprotein [Trichonephila clavipes]|nr:transposon Tf2-6 polyprotein [Trichonephila clavipes]
MFQILLWSPWKYRCGQRTVRMAVVACSQNQAVFARRRIKVKAELKLKKAETLEKKLRIRERKENARVGSFPDLVHGTPKMKLREIKQEFTIYGPLEYPSHVLLLPTIARVMILFSALADGITRLALFKEEQNPKRKTNVVLSLVRTATNFDKYEDQQQLKFRKIVKKFCSFVGENGRGAIEMKGYSPSQIMRGRQENINEETTVTPPHSQISEDQNVLSQIVIENRCQLRVEPQRIILKSDLPAHLITYRTSPIQEKEIKGQVEKLLQAGLVKDNSPYSASVTLAFKRDEEEGKVTPNNTNIDIIKKLKPPNNVKELQKFLGSINVYHKFIPEYADLRHPLNMLLKKDVKFNWTDECQNAFEKLKESLITKPILRLHDPDLTSHVFVDASQKSVGAVLKQPDASNVLHPIAYHSRTIRDYDQNYAITELECLAIIDALDKFYYYLHGQTFIMHTDHVALVWLKSIKNLRGRLFRWSLKLTHHPQINGKNERVSQSLVTRLKCKVNDSSTKIPWTKRLDQVCNEYNSTPHSIAKYPPAYLLFFLLPYQSPIDQNNYYEPVYEARELALQRTMD